MQIKRKAKKKNYDSSWKIEHKQLTDGSVVYDIHHINDPYIVLWCFSYSEALKLANALDEYCIN